MRRAHPLGGAGGPRGEHDADEVVEGRCRLEWRLVIGKELLEGYRLAAPGKLWRQRQIAAPIRIFGVEDAVLEGFELVRDLVEKGQVVAVDDDRAGGGIVADAPQDALAVGEVHRHLHRAALAESAPDGEVVDDVRQHHQNRLLVRDPECSGAVRETVGEAVHLAVAHLLSGHRLHEGLVPEALHRALEHPAHGAILERIVRGHECVHHRCPLGRMNESVIHGLDRTVRELRFRTARAFSTTCGQRNTPVLPRAGTGGRRTAFFSRRSALRYTCARYASAEAYPARRTGLPDAAWKTALPLEPGEPFESSSTSPVRRRWRRRDAPRSSGPGRPGPKAYRQPRARSLPWSPGSCTARSSRRLRLPSE